MRETILDGINEFVDDIVGDNFYFTCFGQTLGDRCWFAVETDEECVSIVSSTNIRFSDASDTRS
jgi:hypothetical protein